MRERAHHRKSCEMDRSSYDSRHSPHFLRYPSEGSHSSGPRSPGIYPTGPPPTSQDAYRFESRENDRSPSYDTRQKIQYDGGRNNQFDSTRDHYNVSRSHMDLSGRTRPESLHLSQDSLDIPVYNYHSREDCDSSQNYRSPTGSHHQQTPPSISISYPRSNPDLHRADPQTPSSPMYSNTPMYPSTNPHLNVPSKPIRPTTLPRRPHSTHGDLTQAGNYGTLPRNREPNEKSPVTDSQYLYPTHEEPATVNQILYGNRTGPSQTQEKNTFLNSQNGRSPDRSSFERTSVEADRNYHPQNSSVYLTSGKCNKILLPILRGFALLSSKGMMFVTSQPSLHLVISYRANQYG